MPVLEFKIVIIGSVAVGKTALTNAIQYEHFEEEYQATIGAGYTPLRTAYEGQDVELQIWDTAGMERYKSLGSIYYRDAAAAIIVYDQTDQESADAVPSWLDSFRATVKTPAYIVIVGNKDDLEKKTVSNDKMQQWAKENGFDFILTSAKTKKNVKELFSSVVQYLVKQNNNQALTTEQKIQESNDAKSQNICC